MKKILFLFLLTAINLNAQVGIGTTTPNNSSILDIDSTTAGMLTPRMNTIQRDAISSPAEGLFIYNLDSNCFQFFDGSTWSGCMGITSPVKALVCPPNPVIFGFYVVSTTTNSTNTMEVTVTTTAQDNYNITTNTVNGYSFSASGVFLTSGTHTITLASTGTPTATGTDIFTISLSGVVGTCTASITVLATAPPVLKNCQALMLAGYTTSGVYTIDPDGAGGNAPYNCYCNQTDNGGGWTLVFNHDVAGGYWTNNTEADFFNSLSPGITTNKYSILSKIDELQTTTGTYEFRLHYPDLSVTNHWSQTFNPRSGASGSNPVPGYTPISIGATGNNWGGINRTTAASHTYLDGSPNDGNWWYSIGSRAVYGGVGVPGPNTKVVTKVQLYIR